MLVIFTLSRLFYFAYIISYFFGLSTTIRKK
nr:MAG TPA: hypothetical protein [Caudoviricetes sp.]